MEIMWFVGGVFAGMAVSCIIIGSVLDGFIKKANKVIKEGEG